MTSKGAIFQYPVIFLWLFYLVAAQTSLPSSYPHDYPGKPLGDFNPSWQKCRQEFFHHRNQVWNPLLSLLDFEVTNKLPNITFPLGRSFAGNLPVNRPNHPNDTLFFYGFEKSPGSLTAPLSPANQKPWGIWLNGGLVKCAAHVSEIFSIFLDPGRRAWLGCSSKCATHTSYPNQPDSDLTSILERTNSDPGRLLSSIQQLQLGQASRLLLDRPTCVRSIYLATRTYFDTNSVGLVLPQRRLMDTVSRFRIELCGPQRLIFFKW